MESKELMAQAAGQLGGSLKIRFQCNQQKPNTKKRIRMAPFLNGCSKCGVMIKGQAYITDDCHALSLCCAT